jgi:hypothetical protein
MVPIIVLQTAPVMHEACRTCFTDEGFVEGQDYILTAASAVADEAIAEGGKQLLVTGTFHGNEEAANRFVLAMKARQPSLRAVSFSVFPVNRPPYDATIDKIAEGWTARLVAEMRTFKEALS